MHIKNYLPNQSCRGCIQQNFFLGHSTEVASQNISFWDTLWRLHPNHISSQSTLRRLHPTTFSLRKFCGIAFSPDILLGKLSKVVFQHFLFQAILHNCILKIFPLRQLSGVILYKSLFEAILWDFILKIFTSRQLSEVVSPHFVLEKLYGVVFPQNIFFETILWNCILKIFSLRQLCGVVFSHFTLRQLCRIVFSKHFI